MHDFQHAPWHLGEWRVEPMLNRLTGPTQKVQLEPKVMQVLVCLAQAANTVVSHDTLLATVWAQTVVHPKVLSRAISELRRAFADDRKNPRFIETIPKKGYRLIAPIQASLPPDPVVPEAPSTPYPLIFLSTGILFVLLAAWWYLPTAKQPTTSAPVPVTTYPGPEHYPALSPDGQRLAFSWQAPEASSLHLYIKQTSTETVLPLTTGPDHDIAPAWSPDGTTLAFFRHTDSTKTLYTIPALGGTPRKLTTSRTRLATQLAWSPDGDWLVYPERQDSTGQLHLVAFSLSHYQTAVLTNPPPHYIGDRVPAFSPDGSQLAFARTRVEGVEDVFLLPFSNIPEHLASNTPRQLTTDATALGGLTWLPSGLVFASDRNGISQLWQHNLRSPNPTAIATGSRPVFAPTAAHTTSELAFVEQSGGVNLWHIDLTDSLDRAIPLHASTQYDGQPQLSPDGTTLAFVSNRTGTFEVWHAQPDGTAASRLTNLAGPYVSQPMWSPNGRLLAFAVHQPEGADIYTLDLISQKLQPATSHPAHDLHPTWAPNGTSLFWTSNRSGTWDIWHRSLADTTSQQITPNGGYAPQRSADGNHLYYTKHGTPGLWHLDIRTRAEKQLLADFAWYDWGAWALAPNGLYFLNRQASSGPSLTFFDFSTQTQTSLLTLPSPLPSNQRTLTRSSDGTSLYIALLEDIGSDIMLMRL